MKYVFPFIIHMEKDPSGIDFWGEFPDIPGCFTQGKDVDDITYMAEDALSLMLFHYENDKTEIPNPSTNLQSDNPDDIVKLITADTSKYLQSGSESDIDLGNNSGSSTDSSNFTHKKIGRRTV